MQLDLIILNTTVITGDGKTLTPRAQIGIAGGKIVVISQTDLASSGTPCLDANGATSLPGIINAHAHGCTFGPSMPSGSDPLKPGDVAYNRNRHLLSGTTTLLNVCGFALADERLTVGQSAHPLRIFLTTAHSPSGFAAAADADGRGLTQRHLQTSVEMAIEQGAVALGEGGGGQTLGGGAQDYAMLPLAIAAKTGVAVDARAARRLKEALLGRQLDRDPTNLSATFVCLCDELGLLKRTEVTALAEVVARSVLTPMHNALAGQDELAALSARTGLPAILHNAAPSWQHILDLARRYPDARLIAAHCNHPSFTTNEAVIVARSLKEAGVVIDVSTLDGISTHWRNSAHNLDALISAGLVDTLSTDFAGGHWDDIVSAIQRMVDLNQLTAPQAVALATGNVAAQFSAFSDAGRLEVGKRADITIVDPFNLGRVRHVLIGGALVVSNGIPTFG